MNSNEIKKFLKETFGLKKVRIRTGVAKNPYIDAWIPYDRIPGQSQYIEKLIYSESFPEGFRQHCLGVIYGKDSSLAKQVSAGNVNAYSIAMQEREWVQVISEWKEIMSDGVKID